MKIKLLLSGGTIDKIYDEVNAKLTFSSTHIDTMLKDARSKLDLNIEQVLMIDSLDMNDEHRRQLLEACRSSSEGRIVITHGTDTMVETAKVLGQNLQGKTVVLLGAMIPYAFGGSDALFNLGAALTAVQLLPPGVYITMNGKVFSWDNVIKNKDRGEFESL